jgi:hypothetical protein
MVSRTSYPLSLSTTTHQISKLSNMPHFKYSYSSNWEFGFWRWTRGRDIDEMVMVMAYSATLGLYTI